MSRPVLFQIQDFWRTLTLFTAEKAVFKTTVYIYIYIWFIYIYIYIYIYTYIYIMVSFRVANFSYDSFFRNLFLVEPPLFWGISELLLNIKPHSSKHNLVTLFKPNFSNGTFFFLLNLKRKKIIDFKYCNTHLRNVYIIFLSNKLLINKTPLHSCPPTVPIWLD